ncbi:hypothetical protein YN1_7160 [Nanoarchaeota archaeon]
MKDSTKDFLELAKEDIENMYIMFNNRKYGMTCYFSQQAIEKYLKAFLSEKGIFDPKKHKTHNLMILLKECIKVDNDFKELEKYPLDKISVYAIELRYNISFLKGTNEEDAKEAIEIAEKVREFILKKLNIQ